MLYLAVLPDGERASVREISGGTGVSEGYLEQIILKLSHAGLTRGARGSRGGYVVGKDASSIRVGDILRTMEGSLAPVACLEKRTCPAEETCAARRTWDALYGEISECVDSISLSDLVGAYRAAGEYAI